MELESYEEQSRKWPQNGNYILASYDSDSIVVYQAYKPSIAKAIVKSQNFHSEECAKSGYSMTRMSWIKTNFLWMMYRSGWATKKDQELILAIRLKRTGFDDILAKSVNASAHSAPNFDHQQWKDDLAASDVRLQWDPDHDPDGQKVKNGRRAIQLGIRNEMLKKLSNDYILSISDITDFVHEQFANLDSSRPLMLPVEKIYLPDDANIGKHIHLTPV